MMENEAAALNRLVPARYYSAVVQVSGAMQLNLAVMNLCRTSVRIPHSNEALPGSAVAANAEHMPFGANSIDVFVLTHVLEFSDSPHDVLRETAECVVPGGIVAISGFNPRSMLGFAKFTNRYAGTEVDEAEFLSVVRVRDWLALLGFETIAGEFAFYRPPFNQPNRLHKFRSLETAGARWWPGLGSIYILVARKKVFGTRMNGIVLRKRALSRGRLFHAVAKRSPK